MIDITTTLQKLDKQSERTVNARDERSFFTHLYNYVEIICRDKELLKAAWQLYGNKYLEDHADNQDGLDVQSILNGELSQSHVWLSILMLSIRDDHRSVSRIYYAWQTLFTFYSLRAAKPEMLLELQSERYRKYRTGSPEHAERLDKELHSVFNTADTSDNIFVRRDDLSLCLEIFHPAYCQWIREYAGQSDKSEADTSKVEVLLTFDGNCPKVKIPSTNKLYSYKHMVNGKPPFMIIYHCYENYGTPITKNDLPKEIELGDKGLIDSLRGSKFYPDENGPLSIFITFSRNPEKLLLHRKRLLNKNQLDELLIKASEETTIS